MPSRRSGQADTIVATSQIDAHTRRLPSWTSESIAAPTPYHGVVSSVKLRGSREVQAKGPAESRSSGCRQQARRNLPTQRTEAFISRQQTRQCYATWRIGWGGRILTGFLQQVASSPVHPTSAHIVGELAAWNLSTSIS